VATARRATVLALLLGCSRTRAPTSPPLRDELGRPVHVRTLPAHRVVSLAPNVTEILFALGAQETLVGVDSFSDYPPAATQVARVGTDLEPSFEKIVALRPDVVVTATTANPQQAAEAIERMGVPIYVTRTETLADLEPTVLDLGVLVGRAQAAHALAARIREGVAGVRAATARAPRVRTLLLVWSDPLFVVGKHTYTSDLLAAAGGANVAEDAGDGFPKYSLERVLRHQPEVMIVGSHKNDDPKQSPFAYWQRFPELPAVRTGRLHAVDGDLIFRPGPRVVEGARALAAILHPELAR